MCFQGFVQCACGHTTLIESECELAAGITFYIKPACPKYHSQNVPSNIRCGRGKFYCLQDRDAPSFEHIHRLLDHTDADLRYIETRSARLDARRLAFHKSADNAGVSRAVRETHPAFAVISTSAEQLDGERDTATGVRMQLLMIIQEAMAHHQRRMAHARVADARLFPPFAISAKLCARLTPDLLRMLLIARSASKEDTDFAVTEDIIDLSQTYSQYTMVRRRPQSNVDYIEPRHHVYPTDNLHVHMAAAERKDRLWSEGVQQHVMPQPLGLNAIQFKPPLDQSTINQSHDQVERPPKASKRASAGLTIRRSTRARNKTVNYAESAGSSVRSREPSPRKSDTDSFSPGKSDVTVSPEKEGSRARHRGGDAGRGAQDLTKPPPIKTSSSLSARIQDWQRRNEASRMMPPQVLMYGDNPTSHAATRAMRPAMSDMMEAKQNFLNQKAAALRWPDKPSFGPPLPSFSAHFQAGRPPFPMRNNMNFSNGGDLMRPLDSTGTYNVSYGLPASGMSSNMYKQFRPQTNGSAASSLGYPNIQPDLRPRQGQFDIPQSWLMHTSALDDFPQTIPPSAQLDLQQPQSRTMSTPASDNLAPPATYQPQPSTNIDYQASSPFNGDNWSNDPVLPEPPYVTNPRRSYEHLRRSLDSAPDLSTPQAPSSPPISTTDPKKRSLPTSSPLPADKRPRLSLRRQDTDDVYGRLLPGDVRAALSSPAKMPSQIVRGGFDGPDGRDDSLHLPLTGTGENILGEPAQGLLLAPMAVMYVPPPRPHPSETSYVPGTDDEVGEGKEEGEDELADIDWSLLNEDCFEG